MAHGRKAKSDIESILLANKNERQKIAAIKITQVESETGTSQGKSMCPIVGIGGSAGGFEAAMDLLRHLPPKTERKHFEEKIQRPEELYRTLFDLVPVAVYVCDADGIIREYNRRAAELWGREPSGNGQGPRFCGSYKIYYPDGRLMPHEECPMARALRGEKLKAEDLEIIVERPDGERRHVIPAPRILTNIHGKITGAINSLFDITEQKRAEAAAMRLAALVRSSRDAVVAKDLNGIITDWNQGAQRIFGYKPKEIIGKSILTLIPPERHFEEGEILRRIRCGESIDHYETIRRCKDGRLIDVSLTISPIRDLQGKIVGVSKIAREHHRT